MWDVLGRLDWLYKNTPQFNASDMLERNRNGRIVFAGDSIGRNQWESLLCMLALGVSNKSSIHEKNGRPITKHKGYLAMRFDTYNLTVEYYRVPFLVIPDRPPQNSSHEIKTALRVDKLHWRSKQWIGANVLIFNAGHWWNQEKTVKMYDLASLIRRFSSKHQYEYSRSIQEVTTDMEAMGHEELGLAKESYHLSELLSNLRSDGHPSLHREPGTPVPIRQDCSHWCLPGVPDVWNELLYAHLLLDRYNTKTHPE
ncbi:hypothetical protein ACLOJK_005917 [Asimina triloba]